MGITFTVQAFNDGLAQGKLRGARCTSCGELHLPPRPICRACGSRQLEWFDFKGTGHVETFTVIGVPLSGFKERSPYAVGIVKLDEGPTISGLLLKEKIDDLRVGESVEVAYIKGQDRTILGFRTV
jgi:uncharacterized OB-fold protein